jgi:hypothetical protein
MWRCGITQIHKDSGPPLEADFSSGFVNRMWFSSHLCGKIESSGVSELFTSNRNPTCLPLYHTKRREESLGRLSSKAIS